MRKAKPIVWLLLIVYIILLLRVSFFDVPLEQIKSAVLSASLGRIGDNLKAANFIPFNTISAYTNMYFKPAINFLGLKILWFIPLGYFIPSMTRNKSFKNALISGMVIILSLEVLSIIISLGRFDIDELILATIGVILGYMCYKTIK